MSRQTLKEAVAQLESDMITDTLRKTGGRVAPAARLLGVPISSMWKKLAKYSISPAAFDPEKQAG